MKTLVAFTILCCGLVLLPGISIGQSSQDYAKTNITVRGGFVGTPTAQDVNLDMMCAAGVPVDNQYVANWDFGPGATPATAAVTGYICEGGSGVCFPSASVTYSTAGDKMVTLHMTHAGKDFGTYTRKIRIYDYEKAAIPHDAVVINSDTAVNTWYLNSSGFDVYTAKTYWVSPGVSLKLNVAGVIPDSVSTVFAEPGSTISGFISNCRFYMKHGSVLNAEAGSYDNDVIYGDGATINTDNTNSNLNNPSLDFDYTNAPPNAAFSSSGVEVEAVAKAISIAPNPTNGNISIGGIPQNVLNISVIDMLGTTVMNFAKPSSDMQIDLSALSSGAYYVRFTFPGAVVTKRIIKD